MIGYDYTSPSGYNQLASTLGVSGDNPGRPLARRLNVAQGALALDQAGFQRYLEPQRQSAIMNLIRNMSPGNRQSQVDAFSRRAQERAAEFGQQASNSLQGLGFGSGAIGGAVGNQFENAASDVANYDVGINSAQGQIQQLMALLQALGLSADPNLANGVLAGQGLIQNSNMNKDQGTDLLGSILGIAGQAAGAGAFG